MSHIWKSRMCRIALLVISKTDRHSLGSFQISCHCPDHQRHQASSPDDAVAALSIQLTPDEIKHMEEAYAPHTVLGYV